jgi:hypothetical protein
MKPTVPIYQLKRKAKLLARQTSTPLHAALDRLAIEQGYRSWSLLSAKHAETSPAEILYRSLKRGDMLLVGARPRQGKTLMALSLAIEAMKAGNRAFFFSLDYTTADLLGCFRVLDVEPARFGNQFSFDFSDAINAGYMIETLENAAPGTLVVVDYLQLLDQRRENPPLSDQVSALSAFARRRDLIIVFVSQIDRAYDAALKPLPDIADVRLPNPIDLSQFSRTCFLQGGSVAFRPNG